MRSGIGVLGCCAGYAIYLAWLSPRVPREFSTAAELLASLTFGAIAILTISAIRLRLLIVPLLALAILCLLPGKADPGKPQLTVIGIGILTVVATIGAVLADWVWRQIPRKPKARGTG